jgi:hypothetical protein
MLAKILSQRHGFKCTVLFSIDEDGTINPDAGKSLSDAEPLNSADLLLLSIRFRNWPEEALSTFEKAYLAGKPIIGLRTSTHAFNGNRLADFGKRVLGEKWVNHWGRHKSEATLAVVEPDAEGSPLLHGVANVFGTTDVYEAYPPADATILLRGRVLAGMTPDSKPAAYAKKRATDKVEQDVNTPMMPVAWTRLHTNESGKTNRVFCTTMGAVPSRSPVRLTKYWESGGAGGGGCKGKARDLRVDRSVRPSIRQTIRIEPGGLAVVTPIISQA